MDKNERAFEIAIKRLAEFETSKTLEQLKTEILIEAGIAKRCTCENCGKEFVVHGGYNTKYCDRIPEGETRSCKVIGAANSFNKNVKTDPVLIVYNRAYQRVFARKRTGVISSIEFKNWTHKAKKMISKVRGDIIRYPDKTNEILENFELWTRKEFN